MLYKGSCTIRKSNLSLKLLSAIGITRFDALGYNHLSTLLYRIAKAQTITIKACPNSVYFIGRKKAILDTLAKTIGVCRAMKNPLGRI